MLLNFQRRFVGYIREGSKTHTIRGERTDGKRPVPGEILHLYTGLRQPGAEFILRAPCLRTEDLRIDINGANYRQEISIGGFTLGDAERDLLAWADGFRYHDSTVPGCPKYTADPSGCFRLMMQFWNGRLPFKGWITYWDYSKAQFVRKAA